MNDQAEYEAAQAEAEAEAEARARDEAEYEQAQIDRAAYEAGDGPDGPDYGPEE